MTDETNGTPSENQEAAQETVPAPEKASKESVKQSQTANDDGSVTFKWPTLEVEPLTARKEDFPQNVLDMFLQLGMGTKLRNFTAADKGATPQQMHDALMKGYGLLKAGVVRVVREAGEGGKMGSLFLDAALRYKKLKAEKTGKEFTDTLESVAKELEALTDEQTEQLKSKNLFKLAVAQIKEERAAAKRKELEAAAMAED